jgi:ribonuclease P protein component
VKITVSLKENHLFRRLYQKGKSAADSRLAIYVRPNGRQGNRLGFTVSTKLGHAVVRNRTRRRLREIYRLHEDELVCGRDVVIVARVRAAESTYQQLEKSFLHLARKLEMLKKEKETV